MGSAFFERFSALCQANSVSPNFVAREIGASSGSVTAWKQGAEPRNATLTKIADYFDVSTDYLLGKEKVPVTADKRSVSDDEIKFALFGGEAVITDEMYDEVRSFAAFIKRREEEKKRKE